MHLGANIFEFWWVLFGPNFYQAKLGALSFQRGGGAKIKVANNGLKYILVLEFLKACESLQIL